MVATLWMSFRTAAVGATLAGYTDHKCHMPWYVNGRSCNVKSCLTARLSTPHTCSQMSADAHAMGKAETPCAGAMRNAKTPRESTMTPDPRPATRDCRVSHDEGQASMFLNLRMPEKLRSSKSCAFNIMCPQAAAQSMTHVHVVKMPTLAITCDASPRFQSHKAGCCMLGYCSRGY